MRFKALQGFWSDETRSEYIEGMSYNGDEIDADLFASWQDESKVEITEDVASAITGEGD